ncbi:hypothetical protein ACFFNX_41345, partial [Actinoallomurus acaciae]
MSQRIHEGPVTDPAAALTAVAEAMSRFGVAADERPGFLATVAQAVRDHHPGDRLTLTVGDSRLRATVGGGGGDRTATAPIAADGGHGDDTALLDLIIEQHEALGWHRQELEQTNQGVLALHAALAETTERLRDA